MLHLDKQENLMKIFNVWNLSIIICNLWIIFLEAQYIVLLTKRSDCKREKKLHKFFILADLQSFLIRLK